MGLAEFYASKWGEKTAAATKKADETPAAVVEAPAAEAKVESTEVDSVPITDADLDAELATLSDEQMAELAKEVATKQKDAAAAQNAALAKEAEELYAAGQIFGEGFLSTVKAGEKVASKDKPKTATEKFAEHLSRELAK